MTEMYVIITVTSYVNRETCLRPFIEVDVS